MTGTKDTITISGRTTNDRMFASEGDIYIYRQDDRNGAQNRRGNHSNYGYSGYYLASIYDGTKWRKLQFNKLVAYENRYYQSAKECREVEGILSGIIKSWTGMVAYYDSVTRSFRINMMEIA